MRIGKRKVHADLVKVLGIEIGIVGVFLVSLFWLHPLQAIGWALLVVGAATVIFATMREIAEEKERTRKYHASLRGE
ncbi:MAG: hypothetical protein A3A27_00030 [Candidatus Wildermuthbacteria bacterium RIFCSPLOWO2_01_FULL_47_18]|uniref:Uncharacterized protein n=1 Tax=Candidatus Wildermuthbacteria bacterium RIFCSPLOWO2_01_FULL_47_18 TaxID=1802460 RepID=A0A1G2RKN6_9BACT|nr:MAG: hypothetical protein A3A27_00030 [Candidatus Wildermuthbacteria bacterium RIFCSPLOWO2_01_FULL_47_18]HXK31562.1 hypothetical protein [Candidatus Paceibacterota bacterium]